MMDDDDLYKVETDNGNLPLDEVVVESSLYIKPKSRRIIRGDNQ